MFPGGGRLFPAADRFQQKFQPLFQLPLPKEHLPRRGDREGGQRVGPALGIQLEIGDGVDLVPPVLDPDGVWFPRREEVEDAAPDGELAHPVHLGASRVPGHREPRDQRLHIPRLVDGGVGAHLKGGLPQRLRLDRTGGGRLGGSDDDRRLPLQNPGEDAQPLLLIFPRDALHLAVTVIPGGEDEGEILCPRHRIDVGRQPGRRQVVLGQEEERGI